MSFCSINAAFSSTDNDHDQSIKRKMMSFPKEIFVCMWTVVLFCKCPTAAKPLRGRSLFQGSNIFEIPYGGDSSDDSDEVISVTEYVPVNPRDDPRRAAIFLTGPEFNGDFWAIDVEGFNAPVLMAERGFYAYTWDYIGVRGSFKPEDGSGVNYVTQLQPLNELIDYVRDKRDVDKIDLITEGYGSEIASQLNTDDRVNSITMSTIVYRYFSPFGLGFVGSPLPADLLPLFDPSFTPGQDNLFDWFNKNDYGYFKNPFLPLTLQHSPQEVANDVFDSQGYGIGALFPTGPFLQVYNSDGVISDPHNNIINAARATVPALVIASGSDMFPAEGDNYALAYDWGKDSQATLGEFHLIADSPHVPRIESCCAEMYYNKLFQFLDEVAPSSSVSRSSVSQE